MSRPNNNNRRGRSGAAAMHQRNKSRGRGGGRGWNDRDTTSRETRRRSGGDAMDDEEDSKHSIMIRNFGNFNKSQVLNLIKRASNVAFRYVEYFEQNPKTLIMTLDRKEIAESLVRLSRKLDNGDITIQHTKHVAPAATLFHVALDGATKSRKDGRALKLQEAITSRFDEASGLLNLDQFSELVPGSQINFNSQQSIRQVINCSGTVSQKVVSLSLNNNNIFSLRVVGSLKKCFPNLRNLCVMANKIKEGSELRHLAPLNLCELVVMNNPFTNEGPCANPDELKRVAAYYLRSLLLLNGATVRQQPEVLSMPTVQKSSFDNPTTSAIVNTFLNRYLVAFDRDRSSLSSVLHPTCCFSLSAVRELTKKPVMLQYRQLRNLAPDKSSLQPDLLHVGAQACLQAMTDFVPGTTHLLQDLLIDSSIVKYAQPEMLLICASGELLVDLENDVASRKIRFDRVLMVAPAPPDSQAAAGGWVVQVLNDMLHFKTHS